MEQSALQEFNDRIRLNTDLSNISKIICDRYNFGDFISNTLIPIGYEDYNYCLETSTGKYFVKIFSKDRDRKDVDGYIERIRVVSKSDVSAPKPFLVDGDIVLSFDYNDNHYDLCVFEYIDGKNFFELGETISEDVIKELAKLTAMIHDLDYKPEFIYDSWAIINFEEQYNLKKDYLSSEYKDSFDKLLGEFKKVDLSKLPYAFVHGDIRSANTMFSNNKVWIVDFAVSNYLPRIIDLSVTSCDMCLDSNSEDQTCKNIKLLLSEYNKFHKLLEYELEVFKIFYHLVNAMYIMQTQYLIKTYGDSEENQDLLNRGVCGYRLSDDKLNEIIKCI